MRLPVAADAIEILGSVTSGQNTDTSGAVRLRAGPAPGDLVDVAGIESGQSDPALDQADFGALSARLRVHTTLFLEWKLDAAPAGDRFSHVSALRCEALPLAVGAELVWLPALVVRVRADRR